MWMKWFPWKWMARQWAAKHGFFDPFMVLSRLESFGQPSEVAYPVEILRLGASLHARGLMNSQVIQHNLDWVWPYWVERQFDPHDNSFMPRAFSLSHINLTHRNWTGIGMPGCSLYPIVDPAGLLTPLFDSWSIDVWIVPETGEPLVPSRLKTGVSQKMRMEGNLAVETWVRSGAMHLETVAVMTGDLSFPVCRLTVKARAGRKAWCVISLRPYNPEGVSFIHTIEGMDEHHGWIINGTDRVYLTHSPDRCIFSDYRSGDVYHFIPHARHREKIHCGVGMASAAGLYELEPGIELETAVDVPLSRKDGRRYHAFRFSLEEDLWSETLEAAAPLKIPDFQFLYIYQAAVRSLILYSPGEVYPGPYTYKHFWFRDAAFILNALLNLGYTARVEKVIDESFFSRQSPRGYFHSQDGEWDSNGQALWIIERFCRLTGKKPAKKWKHAVIKAAKWIIRKRLPPGKEPHAGLLPPGFSAEHLGPNDYYYWDDFWSAAGLIAAGRLMHDYGEEILSNRFRKQGEDLLKCIDKSLESVRERTGRAAVPASPYRRMDTGAIGSIAGGYPLQLWPPDDPRLLQTAGYLMEECLVDGGFFHDMSHSGINPYLTLHLAQVLLRAGDERYYGVMKKVADLASPTAQWPEAIHPGTRGGCMGDGQHAWAAAEWILMVRNCFMREEDDRLILFSGVPLSWLQSGEEISFGPAPTLFGYVEAGLRPAGEKMTAWWRGDWSGSRPVIEIRLPGAAKLMPGREQNQLDIPVPVAK